MIAVEASRSVLCSPVKYVELYTDGRSVARQDIFPTRLAPYWPRRIPHRVFRRDSTARPRAARQTASIPEQLWDNISGGFAS